jgi:predicted DNA-binding WGR domain protein
MATDTLDPVQTIKDMLKIPAKGPILLYRLELVDPSVNSDKFYECTIKQMKDGQFVLIARYGRNGSAGKDELKAQGSESECRYKATVLRIEKKKKGYSEVNSK